METPEINISLLSVNENRQLTAISRWEIYRHPVKEPVDIDISVKFLPLSDTSIVLRLGILYTSTRALVRRPLIRYTVDATFEVSNLEHLMEVDESGILLPRQLSVTMLSIAIGAARGMLALRTRGTFLEAHPLPLYDLRRLVRRVRTCDTEAI